MSTADDVDAKPAESPPAESPPTSTNDDAIDDSNTTPTPPPTPPIFIQGLSVLSPRQNNSTLLPQTDDVAVPLPPLRPEEPVASIRGALSEVLGFAHLTRYRLVVERLTEEQIALKERKRKETKLESEVVNGEKKVGSGNCWSPFTLRDAQVTISPSLKSLETGALLPGSPANSNAEEEELVLDEYGDLSALLPLLENDDKAVTNNVVSISSDNSKIILDASHLAIRVVLEKYDLASIRDHMMRVRQLLEGNAPYVTSLLGEEVPVENEEEEIKVEEVEEKKGDTPEKKQAGEKQESGEDAKTDEEKATEDAEAEAEAEKQAKMEAIASALPTYAPDYDVLFESATQGGDLTNFYYLACGEEQTLLRLQKDRSDGQAAVNATSEWMEGNDTKENKKKGNGGGGRKKKKGGKSNSNKGNVIDKEPMVEIERTLYNLNEATRVSSKVTLRLSGYHPPPAHRRVLGDLAYLEATLPDGSIVQVTAFPLGFYANRSTSSKFDPTPAVGSGSMDACYSHALLDCLLQRSKPFRTSWQSALNAAKDRSDLLRELSLTEDSLHGIFRPVASTFPNNASGPAATTSGGMGMMMSTSPSTFLPRIS